MTAAAKRRQDLARLLEGPGMITTADVPAGGELRLLFSGDVCVSVCHVEGRSRVAVEEGGTSVGGDRH